MKLRIIAAGALIGTLFVAPAFAQMAISPPPAPGYGAPHGYGDYDQHHVWRDQTWWHENDPGWVRQHHPDWEANGAWDKHHKHWHNREWWMKNHPNWVHEHHPHWYS